MTQLLDPGGLTQSSLPTYWTEIELAQEPSYPLTSFPVLCKQKTCKEQVMVGKKNCRRQRKKNQSLPSMVSTCDGWSVVMPFPAKQASRRNMAHLCHQRAWVPKWVATLHQHSLEQRGSCWLPFPRKWIRVEVTQLWSTLYSRPTLPAAHAPLSQQFVIAQHVIPNGMLGAE